jgi:hypothetical protein
MFTYKHVHMYMCPHIYYTDHIFYKLILLSTQKNEIPNAKNMNRQKKKVYMTVKYV